MNLTDEGIAIGVKKFSDSTNLMKILTKDNGIYSGLIRIKKIKVIPVLIFQEIHYLLIGEPGYPNTLVFLIQN